MCLGNCDGIAWKNSFSFPDVIGGKKTKLSASVQCSLPEILLALWVRICKKGILPGRGTPNCCSVAVLGTPQGVMG